ncbi:MAG: NAD(P)/FAD-dependent oxidoreductase [Candidatus Caldarchaeum sp.]|nr:NAD(P)/FAD-dependent oxidoreductase [Candidatus Caldarchaeum sp.]
MLLVVGGSVFAVATAVRLAREGHRVMLVHQGRRVGLFPFALLPESFFSQLGVDPHHHSEAEINVCRIDDENFKTPTLHLTRTTPMLEDALAYNQVAFSHKPPSTGWEKLVDCSPVGWNGVKLFQHVAISKSSEEPCLSVDVCPGLSVSATASVGRLCLKYIYSHTKQATHSRLIAYSERNTAYRLQQTAQTFPTASLAGQDVAETVENHDVLSKASEQVYELLKGLKKQTPATLYQNLVAILR